MVKRIEDIKKHLKSEGWKISSFKQSGNYLHFRQKSPKLFRRNSLRTVTAGNGYMKLIVGKKKESLGLDVQSVLVRKK